jgi:gas vesicle protein
MMENNIDARSLGIGVLVGVVAGLAAGLLFAPQSGRETREQIGEGFQNVREKLGEMGGKVKERFSGAGTQCGCGDGETE